MFQNLFKSGQIGKSNFGPIPAVRQGEVSKQGGSQAFIDGAVGSIKKWGPMLSQLQQYGLSVSDIPMILVIISIITTGYSANRDKS
eukprot:9549220-Karenia_brevis.AAC.1